MMLRVSGKRLVFSVTVVTLRILVILPPNVSEEIWAPEVQVAGAVVLRSEIDGCTHLVAWVLVAAFSASVAAVTAVSPTVFIVLKKADTRAWFLASGFGSSAGSGSVVTVGALGAILCD